MRWCVRSSLPPLLRYFLCSFVPPFRPFFRSFVRSYEVLWFVRSFVRAYVRSFRFLLFFVLSHGSLATNLVTLIIDENEQCNAMARIILYSDLTVNAFIVISNNFVLNRLIIGRCWQLGNWQRKVYSYLHSTKPSTTWCDIPRVQESEQECDVM